jgi:glycosyltransferase involved in cell wall biosynthesis
VIVHRRIEFPVGRRHPRLARLKYGRGVDAYVTTSNRVKETLVEAGIPDWRVFPVHSVTEPERFLSVRPDPGARREFGIPPDAFVVGNVGHLVGHKDHANLLRAAAGVRDQVPNLWVVIVGPGPLREELGRLAESLGMAGRVVFTGLRSDVARLIYMFDLFALSSSEEGICSTLLEVMSCAQPIVATDAGGVGEAVLDGVTGLIVPVRDSAALAAGILRLARDPDLARRLAEAGRRRVLEHFTVEHMAERTLEVYQRVLAGRVGPEHPIDPA